MRKRAMVAVIGLAGAAMALGVGAVDAAPKKGLAFDVSCPGLGSFTVTTPPGEGSFTPALGSTRVFIPYDVEGTVSIDGEVVEEFHDVKPAPVPASAISCDFSASFEDQGAVIEIEGTALVVPRGRPS